MPKKLSFLDTGSHPHPKDIGRDMVTSSNKVSKALRNYEFGPKQGWKPPLIHKGTQMTNLNTNTIKETSKLFLFLCDSNYKFIPYTSIQVISQLTW